MSRLDPARLDRIGGWMQAQVEARRLAGCSVLIREAGTEVYAQTCGLRDLETGAEFGRDTVARIYSMTKPITSLAMMMLVERGLVHLDAPVSAFIPGFADARCLVPGAASVEETEPCAPPTLHQLMTHTSGLTYPFNPGPVGAAMDAAGILFRADEGPLGGIVARLTPLPLAFRPGTRWEYSVGIDVLGHVIERITDRPLDVFLTEEILDPLGMHETRFAVPKAAAARFATLYTPLAEEGFVLNARPSGGDSLRVMDRAEGSVFHAISTHSGGGGLVGTIDDYMRFCEALRTGGAGLVSPATLRFMMRNHLPGDIASMGPASFAEQPMEGMGFGLGGAVVLDPARARCPGSVGDFSWGGIGSTFFWIDPVLDLSVVFFTQLFPSSAYPLRPQLKALVHGAVMQ